MNNVTDRIKQVKQPYGGYLKVSDFRVIMLDDGITLNEDENIHGSIVGLVVDYMTRFLIGSDVQDAFVISMKGAIKAEEMGIEGSVEKGKELLRGITGTDAASVVNACKLAGFDVWYRNPRNALRAAGYEINPDEATVQNIQTLLNRCRTFFEKYGPVTASGFTFEPENAEFDNWIEMCRSGKGTFGGYTPTVCTGDGDYLTADTLWDMKVIKSRITSKETLQLLMYWIMGQHSGRDLFKGITRLGVFNPRYNQVYLYDMHDIPAETVRAVERDVICYD
ncbi:MAG: hypothetical protein K5705_02525 [Oscillospiraceae bacterium]|nr:hypothetical protein [Oscillospiraceae bacterium]